MIRPAVMLVLVCVFAACGASAREQIHGAALNTSYIAVTSAQAGFESWDQSHQDSIVNAATSYEAGVAALEAYWKQQVTVVNAFEAAYRAIAAAALASDDAHALIRVKRAYEQLVLALQVLTKGKVP